MMKNFVSRLNEYSQKTNSRLVYQDVGSDGPDHLRTFSLRVVLNDQEYPEGVGKNKKEAKQNAAENALRALGQLGSPVPETLEKNRKMDKTQPLSRFEKEFETVECLGHGGYGEVYKVKHKEQQMFYAVKIVHYQRKSLREVDALSKLSHTNIIRYFSFWEEESGYQGNDSSADSSDYSSMSTESSASCFLYIQMELCDKITLTKWLNNKNDHPRNDSERRLESLEIALQITKGVRYIHSRGFIHRDLKPDNILFGLDGAVKIGDFGLVTRDGIQENRTVDIGTRHYMAPEQSEETYDRKVDIFPMGLIFLELWWRVSTGSERVEVFGNARCQRLPQQFSIDFFEEMQIIRPMLCKTPDSRPEASEVKKKLKMLKKNPVKTRTQSLSRQEHFF